MNSWVLNFDRLEQEFPFLAWPRVVVPGATYTLCRGRDVLDPETNHCQIFRTAVEEDEDPIVVTLRRHLGAIQYALRYGIRSSTRGASEQTATGGLIRWAERGFNIERPRLAVFRGRGLFYAAPTEDLSIDCPRPPKLAGCWMSDVGLML